MPFKNLFTFASPKMARPSDDEFGLTSEKGAMQAIVVEDIKDLPASVDIHVRMEFDENGNIVTRAVEHLRDNEVSPTPSDDSTLVGTPPVLGDKPDSVDAHTVTESPELMEALVTSLHTPSSPCRATSPSFEVEVEVKEDGTLSPAVRPVSADDFQVACELGSGGQGSVFLVQQRTNGELYALKVAEKSSNPMVNELMFREQEILESIAGSPWFLSLKASFEDDQHFFLLTDACNGGDMEERIKRGNGGKLSDGQARRYCAQIILAMEDLHRRRIIHRDLKPANILLNSQDEVVIADFGYARAFRDTEEDSDRASLPEITVDGLGIQLDITHAQCGTPQYMAPEIWLEQSYSYAVDVWSFGMIMYEMLNGKLPFELDEITDNGGSLGDMFAAVCMRQTGIEVEDDVDDDAYYLLSSILEQDPTRRPSWEQIKEHPWFDGVNWTKLSARTQMQAVVAPQGFIPNDENEEPPFGTPYPTGDEPHPFFQWTSPELQSPPATAPEASPPGSNPPPPRNDTEVATPPQEVSPLKKCTPLPNSHETADVPSASAARSTTHASTSVPLPGLSDQATAPALSSAPSPLAPRQARSSSVVLVSDQRAHHHLMRAAPIRSARAEEVAPAPDDGHAATDADVDDVSASVARVQDDSGSELAPPDPCPSGIGVLGAGLGLGVVFPTTTLAADWHDVDVVGSWPHWQDPVASMLCDDAHAAFMDAPLSPALQFPGAGAPGQGDLSGNARTSPDASSKSPVSFSSCASTATTTAPSAALALGCGSAADASLTPGTSDLEVPVLSAALDISDPSISSGVCSRPLEVKNRDASFSCSSLSSSARSDCSLGSPVCSYDGDANNPAQPKTTTPPPAVKTMPNWLDRLRQWWSCLWTKSAQSREATGGRMDLLT